MENPDKCMWCTIFGENGSMQPQIYLKLKYICIILSKRKIGAGIAQRYKVG